MLKSKRMNPETKLQTVIDMLRDSSTEVKLYTLWDTIGYFQLKNDPEVDSEENLQAFNLMNQHFIDSGFSHCVVTDGDEGTIPFIEGSEKFIKKKKIYNSYVYLECTVICKNDYLIELIEHYIKNNDLIYESDKPFYVQLRGLNSKNKTKPEETWDEFCKDNESTVSSIIDDTIRESLMYGETDSDIKRIIDIMASSEEGLNDICWLNNLLNFNVNEFKFTLSKKI